MVVELLSRPIISNTHVVMKPDREIKLRLLVYRHTVALQTNLSDSDTLN